MPGIYVSTFTFTHEDDLSCCYRNWKAGGAASVLRGYSLGFKLIFECQQLDEAGRVLDISTLEEIRAWLRANYRNTVIVDEADPHLNTFRVIEAHGLCDLRVLQGVGCEGFARHVFDHVNTWMFDAKRSPRVIIRSVECSEHDGHGALYLGNY